MPLLRLRTLKTLMGGLGWYRNQFRNAMKLVLFMIVALCLLSRNNSMAAVQSTDTKVLRRHAGFAACPAFPLDRPVLTQQGLLNWVSETTTSSMSLDFS